MLALIANSVSVLLSTSAFGCQPLQSVCINHICVYYILAVPSAVVCSRTVCLISNKKHALSCRHASHKCIVVQLCDK